MKNWEDISISFGDEPDLTPSEVDALIQELVDEQEAETANQNERFKKVYADICDFLLKTHGNLIMEMESLETETWKYPDINIRLMRLAWLKGRLKSVGSEKLKTLIPPSEVPAFFRWLSGTDDDDGFNNTNWWKV